MSFSQDVKAELSKTMPNKKHCQYAELGALLVFNNVSIREKGHNSYFNFFTENLLIAKKVFTFFKKFFNIDIGVSVRNNPPKHKYTYSVEFMGNHNIQFLMEEVGLVFDAMGHLKISNNVEYKKSCCIWSFARGAFLSCGTISDPSKAYSFEMNFKYLRDAEFLQELLKEVINDIKIVKKRDYYSVYIKDSQSISDMLAGMGANVSMLDFENVKIVNETRGIINRRVNCEVSNLRKSAEAGRKQIESIELIKKERGLDSLPEGIRVIAELRLEYPDLSIGELGQMLNPPLGKSGVNHRLQKLINEAESIRSRQEDIHDN